MKRTITLSLVFLVVLLASCASVEIQETFTDFEKVEVVYDFTVDISQGEEFSVVLNVPDNLVELLEVGKEGDTLKIGLKEGGQGILGRKQVEITMPELTGLKLIGSSDGSITGFKSAQTLDVSLSGNSSLKGDIEAGDVSFAASGDSNATLSGSGQNLTVEALGNSTVDLAQFSVGDAYISAGGNSNVTVDASGRLDADASGASHVYYLGEPTLGEIDISDNSSSVEPK
jgi:hypothetical protein